MFDLLTQTTAGNAVFDLAKFKTSIEQDPHFKNFDFDAFEAEYSKVEKQYATQIEELSKRAQQISDQRIRALYEADPEQLRQQILQREIQVSGIDWVRFYAGKTDERDAVEKLLKKSKLTLSVDDLLSGKAGTQFPSSSEFISKEDALGLEGVHGEAVKTFAIQRVQHYQEIKDAINNGANNFGVTVQMFAAGILGFGELGGRTAVHAQNAGADKFRATLAGVVAIGGAISVGAVIAGIVLAFIWFLTLVFTPANIMIALVNRTNSALACDLDKSGDVYVLHGSDPVIPNTVTFHYPGTGDVCASPQFIEGPDSAIYVGYYFGPGKVGLVGVNGAFRLNMYRPSDHPGATGLGQNHIYIGYASEKIGASYILAGITSDPSAERFYDRHFTGGDSSATNGTITVSSRMNDYSWSISSKQQYQMTVVTEIGT